MVEEVFRLEIVNSCVVQHDVSLNLVRTLLSEIKLLSRDSVAIICHKCCVSLYFIEGPKLIEYHVSPSSKNEQFLLRPAKRHFFLLTFLRFSHGRTLLIEVVLFQPLDQQLGDLN